MDSLGPKMVKLNKALSTSLALALLAGVATQASAADLAGDAFKDCTCVTPQVAGQPIANLSEPVGDVLYSGAKGYTKATKAVTLSDGSVVATGTAAGARVTSGAGCDIAVDGNSLVSVSTPNGAAGNVCIKVAELTPAAFALLPGAGAGGLAGLGLAAPLIGGAILVGVGIAAISK
jgi:hypothetical protein